jgi:hypothetical protein
MGKESSRKIGLLWLILLAVVVLAGCTPKDYTCQPREAEAAPPPVDPPKLAAEGRAGEELPTPNEPPKPLCPEGQVPVASLVKAGLPKGNPLLQINTLPIEPGQTPDVFIKENLRPFEEVYWKGRGEEQNYKPLPPDPNGKCDGVTNPAACYYYAAASYRRDADGGGMTMSVERPAYTNSGGSGHTLNEIAVQGGSGDGNIVELGWNVSSDQYSNANPHIFVFHWINWSPTCYDACGWQQYSATYFPGQDINFLVGRDVYIGYVFYEGNWWAWFDNQWLGYYPGSEWKDEYKRNSFLQWFGEVASNNGIPPLTDMGNGLFPSDENAAHMLTLCDVSVSDWICWYRDQQSLGATVPSYYDISRFDFGATRYGGPGE